MKMNRRRKTILALPLVVILAFVGYNTVLGIPLGFAAPTLEFPVSETDRIE